ncbi:RNA polymerase sigma factor [Arhodomonas sp. SL1]|uniref:RNA polymerase sigma factor n=1 Tax=Arhodomonas sp. SL1 TaxID=3425691 RepID=UPI003F884850
MKPPESEDAGPAGAATRRRVFEQEVTRLMNRLYGTALRLSRDPDDAEDVVAEAVGRAWSRLGELREWRHFEGWLFRILHTSFIDSWRRRRSRQDLETGLDDTDSEASPDEQGFSLYARLHQPFLLWWGTAEDEFFNRLLREDLQHALDTLPDAFRIPVVLVEVEGYTYREVADLLEVPIGTVRSRLSRARALLQKALWEYDSDGRPDHPEEQS